MWLGEDSCALCKLYADSPGGRCSECPLYQHLGGVRCDDGGPYYRSADDNGAAMRAALEEVLVVEETKQEIKAEKAKANG
jgi:hypothetical protein